MFGPASASRLAALFSCGAIVLLLFSPSASAGLSLALSPGLQGTFNIPNSAPFKSVQDLRIELRLHELTCPPAGAPARIWEFGNGLSLHCWLTGTQLAFWDANFSVAALWNSPSPSADVTLRLQWDHSAGKLYVEQWDTTTAANYVYADRDNAGKAVRSLGGACGIGTPAALNVKIAWVRVYSTLVPMKSRPPRDGTGDLLDWEFERRSLLDSSGHRVTISLRSPVFVSTPIYPPVAMTALSNTTVNIPDPALRAGYPARLDGSRSYSLGDSADLTYSWRQIEGPTTLQWEGADTATPVIRGLVFGQYTVRLTVTDSNNQPATSDLTFGAVASDDRGVVIFGNPVLDYLFGPIIRFGANPWEWADSSQRNLSNKWGSKYNVDPNYSAQWRQFLSGTIDVSANSTNIVGHGTAFDADFCGGRGNRTPVANAQLVIYDPAGAKSAYDVAACNGATALTLQPYEASRLPALSDATYAAMTVITPINWGWGWNGAGGGNNANYYDDVLAHYNLYYRTGLNKYRDYARTLASLWTDSPWFGAAPFPRVLALTGIMLSAWESNAPEKWGLIEPVLDARVSQLTSGQWSGDVRENAYLTAYFANAARMDPRPAKAQTYFNAVQSAITDVWIPTRNAGGYSIQDNIGWSWRNAYDQLGFTPKVAPGDTSATVPPGAGVVSVSNGSAQVTGSGTNFLSVFCRGKAGHPPHWNNPSAWERIVVWAGSMRIPAFIESCDDNTHLTLRAPWNGSSGTGLQWSLSWPYWSMDDLWQPPVNRATLTQNSTKVTFTNTVNARDLFCEYESTSQTPAFYSVFIAKVDPDGTGWTSTAADQRDSRVFMSQVKTCTSASEITLDSPWPYTSGSYRWGMGGKALWLESDPKEVGYQVVFTDPVTAVLDSRAVNGTQPGEHFRVDGGPTVQPFMAGMAATAFNWVSKLTGNPTMRDYITQNARWLIDHAIIPKYWGYYYAFAPGCWTDPTRLMICGGIVTKEQDIWSARYLTSETYNGLAAAYLAESDPNLLTATDSLYSACFGRTGYAGSHIDNQDCREIWEAEVSPYYDKAKTLGFFYGMGNIAAWPAARLGGALPEQPSTLPVEFDVSTVNGAVAARMTVTQPSGAQTTTQCANTPCSVPVDLRQGDHWVRTEYLDANGAALPQAATHLLKISPDLGSPAQPANNNR